MKITPKQVTQLRHILEQQRLKDAKLSKALWGIVEGSQAPKITYVDILEIINIINPKLRDELYYNVYECPFVDEEGKIEVEGGKVVKVKRNDLDSVLRVLEALDLLAKDEDICGYVSGVC